MHRFFNNNFSVSLIFILIMTAISLGDLSQSDAIDNSKGLSNDASKTLKYHLDNIDRKILDVQEDLIINPTDSEASERLNYLKSRKKSVASLRPEEESEINLDDLYKETIEDKKIFEKQRKDWREIENRLKFESKGKIRKQRQPLLRKDPRKSLIEESQSFKQSTKSAAVEKQRDINEPQPTTKVHIPFKQEESAPEHSVVRNSERSEILRPKLYCGRYKGGYIKILYRYNPITWEGKNSFLGFQFDEPLDLLNLDTFQVVVRGKTLQETKWLYLALQDSTYLKDKEGYYLEDQEDHLSFAPFKTSNKFMLISFQSAGFEGCDLYDIRNKDFDWSRVWGVRIGQPSETNFQLELLSVGFSKKDGSMYKIDLLSTAGQELDCNEVNSKCNIAEKMPNKSDIFHENESEFIKYSNFTSPETKVSPKINPVKNFHIKVNTNR